MTLVSIYFINQREMIEKQFNSFRSKFWDFSKRTMSKLS
ncbi:Permease of the drug/metabolite transporter (DMT) superfamily [Crocosphaera watsonii WH 0402]|uniref:Permease of the drug/metabolite transporter (DMT) superfamily n=2 Tax=Crocosphaera watsonii TaxID=263511 RepID=T2JIN7_CROWT|nr:Permease of the drug/metabolite transporter (DMT) superfamily [Crocosphaera watsonii WH 0401]CCQ65698.1 Permease of the drug/metabolite transporter (DMT) superfamily [Crocosphaera watsonii WH 0402]